MKTLTIRDVPDDLHVALKARAQQSRRSLNQQVIAELSRATPDESNEQRAMRVEKEIMLAATLRSRATGFMTASELDAAKREGLI